MLLGADRLSLPPFGKGSPIGVQRADGMAVSRDLIADFGLGIGVQPVQLLVALRLG